MTTTHDDPLPDIAAHAAAVLHAALAAGTHAATLLAHRRDRTDRTRAAGAHQVVTLADQRRVALERLRALPPATDPVAATGPPSPGDPSALERAQARYDDQWGAVLRVAGADEDLAAALRAAPGLPALVEDCERWGSEGRMVDLEAALAGALTERSFDGVRDPAAVVRYRIAEHLGERPGAVPGRGGTLPPTARAPHPQRSTPLGGGRRTPASPLDHAAGPPGR